MRRIFPSISSCSAMACAYAAAGVAAAYSGSLLAAALQNAWVLGAFALVFVWLALSMFGLHDLQLPGFLRHRLHGAHGRLAGGRIASVAAMGVLSAVIVSPCVAAPLAGARIYLRRTRDVLLGGAARFAVALGWRAAILVRGIRGAFSPKSGVDGSVKNARRLLLVVALGVVSPVLPSSCDAGARCAADARGFLRQSIRCPTRRTPSPACESARRIHRFRDRGARPARSGKPRSARPLVVAGSEGGTGSHTLS